MLQGKQILVTGGAGAIGTALVRKLIAENEVTILDNLSSGRRTNVEDLNAQLVVADIRDVEKLRALFAKNRFDVVIHLAAHFANQNSVDFPCSDLSVNVTGTLNLLELCREYKPRFVFASSSCVYGNKSGALHEGMPVNDLHTPYAISKYSGELYCQFYATHYDIETVVLRFFNNYGPFDPPGEYRNVIPNFIQKALRGEELVITGTGDEMRDFTHCDNTTHGIMLAAAGQAGTHKPFDVLNVGTGQEARILDVAERIVRLTGEKSNIRIVGKRRSWDHTVRRCADISASRQRLGYEPRVTLETGLPETVEWIRNHYGQPYEIPHPTTSIDFSTAKREMELRLSVQHGTYTADAG